MYVNLCDIVVDGLEFDFFLTHQLFISVSELCSVMMQKYPLITALLCILCTMWPLLSNALVL